MGASADQWDSCLEQASLSDVGLRRANNQDSKAVVLASGPEKWRHRGHLFMVADGMGAHAAGELASKLATDVVPLTYHKLKDRPPPDALREAVRDANRQIHARGQSSEDFRGMGTTVSTLVIMPQGALVAHVGDSRAYRLRNNRLEQLTFDHSLVWEVRVAERIAKIEVPEHVPKNVITRSLGPNADVLVDLEGPFPVQRGDVFLVCSDGLSGQVADEEIGKIIGCMSPEEAVRSLVDLANLRGGPDNITVIVVRVTETEANSPSLGRLAEASGSSPVRSMHPALAVLIAVLALLTIGCGALAALSSSLYVAPAVVSGVGTLVALLTAFFHRKTDQTSSYRFDGRPLGRGPYVSVDCTADAKFVGELANVIQRLRELAGQNGWTIDWDQFNALTAQADAAAEASDFSTAIRKSCFAISFLVGELKGQHEAKKPS